MGPTEERSEIAFFDVETTVPTRPGQGFALLEFGAILVCPRKLVELHNYSTLVRPANPSFINSLSVRCNGITPDAVVSAPTFAEIADTVFDILNGRIWAGHNIVRFDCVRIKEAFAEIGRPAPEPKGTIDSLSLLTQRFGRRAGDMKMASLATYFGLGPQTHRSLDDVRMNLEVLKYCATVLFLESSLPDIFTMNSWVSPNATTRSRSNTKSSPEGTSQNFGSPTSRMNLANASNSYSPDQRTGNIHPILSLVIHSSDGEVSDIPISNTDQQRDPFDMLALSNEMKTNLQRDVTMEENSEPHSSEISSATSENSSATSEISSATSRISSATSEISSATSRISSATSEGSSADDGFIKPDEISVPCITASFIPLFNGSQIKKIKLLHKGMALQLCCPRLKVRFGISTKFVDNAGRPRLNFVVDACPSLCRVLDECDAIVQKVSEDSGSDSEWRPALYRRPGFYNYPTARLHIPTVVIGDVPQYATEMYQKEASSTVQKLVFQKFDAAELDTWFKPGTFVDAFISLDPYDYQQSAGIRLVAKKLIIHSD